MYAILTQTPSGAKGRPEKLAPKGRSLFKNRQSHFVIYNEDEICKKGRLKSQLCILSSVVRMYFLSFSKILYHLVLFIFPNAKYWSWKIQFKVIAKTDELKWFNFGFSKNKASFRLLNGLHLAIWI